MTLDYLVESEIDKKNLIACCVRESKPKGRSDFQRENTLNLGK